MRGASERMAKQQKKMENEALEITSTADADEDEWSEAEPEPLFSCPFCGATDDGCVHYLGSRDMHFNDPFGVDVSGPLDALRGDLSWVGEMSEQLVTGPSLEATAAAVKPRRLRRLLLRLASGKEKVRAAQSYLFDLARDTSTPITSSFCRDDGFSGGSTIQLFWVRDAALAAEGMRRRLERDVRMLESLPPE
jgi:hypothetical protein